MSESQETVSEELLSCPCCNKQFFARVIYRSGETDPLYAFHLRLCDQCRKPCCPRCEHMGGEQVICTLCTSYPSCSHTYTNPEQELYQRLILQRGYVSRIKIGWNASDGGPRMGVKLLDLRGVALDHWEDWAILSSGGRSGAEIMAEIITAALGARAIRDRDVGAYFANFEVA